MKAIPKKYKPNVLVVEAMPCIFGSNTYPILAEKKQLTYEIDSVIWLQQIIIDLADNVLSSKRWQLLAIILKSSITIVFHVYNLTMFAFTDHPIFNNFAPLTACIFYGYQILNAALDILLTIFGCAMTFDEIENVSRIANELSIFLTEENLRIRIITGTTTYIFIFIQSGGFNDLLGHSKNKTFIKWHEN